MDSGNGRTQRKLDRRSNITSPCIWEEAEAQGVKPFPRAIQLETETRFENPGLSLLPRVLLVMTEWQTWAPPVSLTLPFNPGFTYQQLSPSHSWPPLSCV